MTLIVEDGTGVAGANSYSAIATIDNFWALRINRPEAIAWSAATDAIKEAAAVEATDYLDATYGPYYRGTRLGYVQGLLFPRIDAFDAAGNSLPTLPTPVVVATCELAGRAVTARLAEDAEFDGQVKRERLKAGPVELETEYAGVVSSAQKFGIVAGLLYPILNGSQVTGSPGTWSWA